MAHVGGVTQWLGGLGGKSLTGELSLIYARSMVWVKCPPWVNQPGQLSLPSLRGRKISSNPRNYTDYGGGDH